MSNEAINENAKNSNIKIKLKLRKKLLPKIIAVTKENLLIYPKSQYKKHYCIIIYKLNKSLELERKRANANDWAYNYNRHKTIIKAIYEEEKLYSEITSQQ